MKSGFDSVNNAVDLGCLGLPRRRRLWGGLKARPRASSMGGLSTWRPELVGSLYRSKCPIPTTNTGISFVPTMAGIILTTDVGLDLTILVFVSEMPRVAAGLVGILLLPWDLEFTPKWFSLCWSRAPVGVTGD